MFFCRYVPGNKKSAIINTIIVVSVTVNSIIAFVFITVVMMMMIMMMMMLMITSTTIIYLYRKADRFEFCCIAKLTGSNCSAPKDLFSGCHDLMVNKTLRSFIWILGCIALLGNGFVFTWRLRTKTENKSHSLLLLSLAMADFLMGLYLIIIGCVDQYYRGRYFIVNIAWKTSHLCQACGFLSTVGSEASVFILTTMTIDRYFSIAHPYRRINLTESGTFKAVTAIWISAVALAVIPLLPIGYFQDHFYARSGVCLPLHLTSNKPSGWEYSVFLFLGLNLVSLIIVFVLYFLMFKTIKNTRRLSGMTSATGALGTRMVFIVLTDFCCWIPIIIIGIASLLGMQAPPDVYAWVAVFVLPFNSALNPILYTISTANFQRTVKGSIKRKKDEGTEFITVHTALNGHRSTYV